MMALLAAVAALLLTSLLTLGLSTALVNGYSPGRDAKPFEVRTVPPVIDEETQPVELRSLNVPIAGGTRAAVLATPSARGDKDPSVPGVILVAGSGSADENSMRAEAIALAKRGISVLSYDKDETNYSPLNCDYAALADDAADAAAWLVAQPGIDPTRVGLLGFSEGGWIAPMAAARSAASNPVGHDPISFVSLVSAPVVTPLENAAFTIDQAIAEWPAPVRAMTATAMSGGRWLCNYLDVDLRTRIDPLTIPVLAVFGADDPTVPIAEASDRLRAIAPNAAVEVVGGAGHHVPVTTGDWISRAAAWMVDPTTFSPGIAGAPATQKVGLLSLPTQSWFLHPGIHLGVSLLAAVAVGYAVRQRSPAPTVKHRPPPERHRHVSECTPHLWNRPPHPRRNRLGRAPAAAGDRRRGSGQ